jgi:hypothetical protein
MLGKRASLEIRDFVASVKLRRISPAVVLKPDISDGSLLVMQM